MKKALWLVLVLPMLGACAFNFEITSQRTALENQIIGSYKELDEDLLMMSSVRAVDADGEVKEKEVSPLQAQAIRARESQQFNRDDLDDLKNEQLVGERLDGTIAILPGPLGFSAAAKPDRRKLAQLLVIEENRDRQVIWRRVIEQNQNLSNQDMPNVRRTFYEQQVEKALPGHWYQTSNEEWQQKK